MSVQCHFHDIELIVDKGSSVSIISVSMYKTLFPTCELAKPTVTLLTYSKQLTVMGSLHATVTHAGHSTTGSLMVV